MFPPFISLLFFLPFLFIEKEIKREREKKEQTDEIRKRTKKKRDAYFVTFKKDTFLKKNKEE